MRSARRARPFAESVYQDDDGADTMNEVRPHAPDDRTYIILMYQEHAQQARQQNALRNVWAVVTLILASVLAVLATAPDRAWTCGVLLCCVGVLGAVGLIKANDRYEMHLNVMRAFRNTLAEAVRSDIPKVSYVARVQHQRSHRGARLLPMHALWILGCLAAIGVGGEIVWRHYDAAPLAPIPLDGKPAPARMETVPLSPGQELP